LSEQQPLLGHGAPNFGWSPGILIEDVDNAPVVLKGHKAEIGHFEEIAKDNSIADDNITLAEEEEIIEDGKADKEEPDHASIVLNDMDKSCVGNDIDIVSKDTKNKGAAMKVATKKKPQSRRLRRLGDTISDLTGLATTTTGLHTKWTIQRARKATRIHSSCTAGSKKRTLP
jgi:hypothetical protein